jgi:hypothetical protein
LGTSKTQKGESMKKIALLSCLIVFVALVSVGSSFAGTVTSWEMIYDHDSAGAPLNNTNINNLKAAVLNGSDVKIIFHGNGGTTHHSIQLTRVRVETSADGASTVSVIGFYDETAPTPATNNWLTNGLFSNATGTVIKLQSFSTTGQYASYYPAGVLGGDGTNVNLTNVPITWYVSR